MNIKDIEIEIVQLKSSDDLKKASAVRLYEKFHEIWSKEYLEIDGIEELYSDKFLEFHHAITIKLNGSIAGGLFFRDYNFNSKIEMSHSVFKEWDRELINNLSKQHGSLCFATHLFLDQHHRSRTIESYNISRVLIEIVGLHMFYGIEKNCIASLRNERNVNKLCEYIGSIKVDNIKWRGMDVDIVKFTKDSIRFKKKSFIDGLENKYLEQTRENVFENKREIRLKNA